MRGRFEVNSDNIGNLLNNPKLEAYDRERSSMYVYDLAVSRQYRRNGIGSKLVGEIMLDCESKHIKDLFVHADAADRHAVEFYKKVGGEPAAAFRFSLPI
jgi:aminoglycoside 3-N-acetyltransferase I